MKLEYLFPSIVLKEQLDNNRLSAIKKEIELKFKEIDNLLSDNSWDDRVVTTFKNCICIISYLNFFKVKEVVDPLVQIYINTLDITYKEFKLSESWINIVPPLGFQGLHIHNSNMISGCLYLDVPENSGEIQFQPSMPEIHIKPSVNYTPIAGNIFIFHGMTPHRVLYNKSTKNRISLSFNYSYTS